jgi:hypothetical protein
MRWACRLRHVQLPLNCRFSEIVIEGARVDEARNAIVGAAVKNPEFSHVWFLDDDVLVHGHALLQLLAAKKDIVAGVYFTKGPFGEPLIFEHEGAGATEYLAGTGLRRVWGCGMGLTLIRTAVFRRMADELDLGVDGYGSPRWFYTSGDKAGETERMTEDLWFCQNAERLGIERYVDTSPYAFGWHWDKTAGHAWPQPQWSQHDAGEPVKWDITDDALELLQSTRKVS